MAASNAWTWVLVCPVRWLGPTMNGAPGKYSWAGRSVARLLSSLNEALPLGVSVGMLARPSDCIPLSTVVSGGPVVQMNRACGLAALILDSWVVTLTSDGSKVWWLTPLTAPPLPAAAFWMFSQPSWPEESVEVMAATRVQPLLLTKLMNALVWLTVEFDVEYT